MIKPYYKDDLCTLYHGDCREVMPHLELVDHICTDPPYGLKFMGKDWDKGVPGKEFWRIASEICKPGAMLMAFGGTRTYHRLVCAIEDADWEIRDCLMWVYGSGMPHSHNIGKAIDKAAGVEREVIGPPPCPAGNKPGGNSLRMSVVGMPKSATITVPATADVKTWEGWGSGLKPALEPICLAMKKLDGTYANNALTHNVAGLNIKDSMIGVEERYNAFAGNKDTGMTPADERTPSGKGLFAGKTQGGNTVKGRWPSNLLLEECEEVLSLFPNTKKTSAGVRNNGACKGVAKGADKAHQSWGHLDKGGSAARFFYTSKVSKKERGEFNKHPTVKPIKLMSYLLTLLSTPVGGVVLDPFVGSGTTLLAAKALGKHCIGIEQSEEHCETIVQRIKAQNGT